MDRALSRALRGPTGIPLTGTGHYVPFNQGLASSRQTHISNRMPKKRVTIYETDHVYKALPNELLKNITIGFAKSEDRTFSTHLRVYVPTPAKVGDIPGVVLRMSNSAGSTFSRLSAPEELRAIGEFLIEIADSTALSTAMGRAHQAAEIFIEADKTLQELRNKTQLS